MSFRHLLVLLTLLALFLPGAAAPPAWWATGNPPIIAGGETNHRGPANIGQAKWMVAEALRALDTAAPAIALQIRADLTGTAPSFSDRLLDLTVPNPKPPAWIEAQKAPLLLGQLKAISAPFYTRLHAAHPTWLTTERTENATHLPDSIFPWTTTPADDQNQAIATLGQLKAVFSLRFETLPPVDQDNDGLPDIWELANGLDPQINDSDQDPDNDGYTNLEEYINGTNPRVAGPIVDADNDGMSDRWEIRYGLNPTLNDSPLNPDGDLLPDGTPFTNLMEFQADTNPNLSDTDSDGMPDGWEVSHSLKPRQNDAIADPDVDKLTNLQEFQNLTNPQDAFTDDDGLPDGWEVQHQLNPLSNQGVNGNDGDSDGDGLTNFLEFLKNTNPKSADTDGDGINDLLDTVETGGGDNDGSADPDGDGLTNNQEIALGTNPNSKDSDGDQLGDKQDADPKDRVIDWAPAPEASYAVIEMEQVNFEGYPSPAGFNPSDFDSKTRASIGKSGTILWQYPVKITNPTAQNEWQKWRHRDRVWKNGVWISDITDQVTTFTTFSTSASYPSTVDNGTPRIWTQVDVTLDCDSSTPNAVCGDLILGLGYYFGSKSGLPVSYTSGIRNDGVAYYGVHHVASLWAIGAESTTAYPIDPPDGNKLMGFYYFGGSAPITGIPTRPVASPGGALAILGTQTTAGVGLWKIWDSPSDGASQVPGQGSPTVINAGGGGSADVLLISAIEDGGIVVGRRLPMVAGRLHHLVVNDHGSESILPGSEGLTHSALAICRVPTGVSGQSRVVTAGTDLWVQKNGKWKTAKYKPSTNTILAIAKNGVLLGTQAIWRNGKEVSLDSLVASQKVAGPTSAARYTKLVGYAMNGEGSIVALADDALHPGTGKKTLLNLLPVEVNYVDRDVMINQWAQKKPFASSADAALFAGPHSGDMVEWRLPGGLFQNKTISWKAKHLASGEITSGPSGVGVNFWRIANDGGNDPEQDQWLKWKPGKYMISCEWEGKTLEIQQVRVGYRSDHILVIGQIVPTFSHDLDKPTGGSAGLWASAVADDITSSILPAAIPLDFHDNVALGMGAAFLLRPETGAEAWAACWAGALGYPPGLVPGWWPSAWIPPPVAPPAVPTASVGPAFTSYGGKFRPMGTMTARHHYWATQHMLNTNPDTPTVPAAIFTKAAAGTPTFAKVFADKQYRVFHEFQAKFLLTNQGKIEQSTFVPIHNRAAKGTTKLKVGEVNAGDWGKAYASIGVGLPPISMPLPPFDIKPFPNEDSETNLYNEKISHAAAGDEVSSFATARIGEKGRRVSYRQFGKDAPWIFSEIIFHVKSDWKVNLMGRTSTTVQWDLLIKPDKSQSVIVSRSPYAPVSTSGMSIFNNLNLYARSELDQFILMKNGLLNMEGHLQKFVESGSGAWPEPPIPPTVK